MITNTNKTVLILAPHTDDGEFGCGGTISKFIELNYDIHYVAFSSCDGSLSSEYPKDTLIKELSAAADSLSIPKQNVQVLDFPVRRFSSYRQEILDQMVLTNRSIKPDLVFLPSTHDTHQDHNVISTEGFRAFKQTTILGYELPWNNISFVSDCFVSLNENNVLAKVKALKCYASQKSRPYADVNYIKSLATTRGVQIGSNFAEAFQTIRMILR